MPFYESGSLPINLKNLNLLIVEDTPSMLELMGSVLEAMGVGTVYTTENPKKGLEIVKARDPDIIICDWEMPDFDGIQFTQAIRTSGKYPNKTVPIVMVSGHGTLARVKTARDAGINEFIVKPFTAQKLADRIAHVINNPREFVESQNYVGPDRRRKSSANYSGPLRRSTDLR